MDYQVYIQSNLFPRLQVYDSTQPPGALSQLLQLGYSIESDGLVLYASPQQPTVSPTVQLLGMGAVLAAFGFILTKVLK